MNFRIAAAAALSSFLLMTPHMVVAAEQSSQSSTARKVRVTGVVRDESNNITLPGIAGRGGRRRDGLYRRRWPLRARSRRRGRYEIKVAMEGYETQTLKVDVPAGVARDRRQRRPGDVALRGDRTVTADAFMDAVTSSAESQIADRKAPPVITDNLGSQDMKKNADTDAAAAMSRVTGLSVVDNQYVFVRGLGERYSNTTLSGSTLPTTEPDKKVVPLDLFPGRTARQRAGQQVVLAGSARPSLPADWCRFNPLKFPSRAVLSISRTA